MTSYVKNGTCYDKKKFKNIYQILINNFIHPSMTNNIKGLKITEECQKVAFFCISYIKHPYKGRFAKTWLTITLNLTAHEQTKVFLNLQTLLLIAK